MSRWRASRWCAVITSCVTAAGCAGDPPAAIAQISVTSACRNITDNGIGTVTEDGLILASAHVVAGAEAIEATVDHQTVLVSIVAFDPDNDLAYLRADRRLLNGWPVASSATLDRLPRNTPGWVYVERDGHVERLDATVVRRVNIDTEDIYIDRVVTRPGWEISYPIQPGDSGAPVVVNGEIIGVIWARSRSAELRAWAMDPVEGGSLIEAQLAFGRLDVDPDIPVDVERC